MTGETQRKGTTRGFKRTSALLESRIRTAGESRGFAVARLLTHWAEITGPDLAEHTRPVQIRYGRGFGATLTILTTGAHAPMVEMQKDRLRERVNACYGYAAISAIRVTQTAAEGFAEGRAVFSGAEAPAGSPPVPAEIRARAADTVAEVENDDLRAALEALGKNVLSRNAT